MIALAQGSKPIQSHGSYMCLPKSPCVHALVEFTKSFDNRIPLLWCCYQLDIVQSVERFTGLLIVPAHNPGASSFCIGPLYKIHAWLSKCSHWVGYAIHQVSIILLWSSNEITEIDLMVWYILIYLCYTCLFCYRKRSPRRIYLPKARNQTQMHRLTTEYHFLKCK